MKLSKTGRRVWNLTFSFLDDGNIFGANQMLNNDIFKTEIADGNFTFDDNDVNASNEFIFNITQDDSFFSQVINKTLGGSLPFIFQPDNQYPDFAICKFDQNSFSFAQQSPNLYRITLKIREIW